MKLKRNTIFILCAVCVCFVFALYSCKTPKESIQKKGGQTVQPINQDSVKAAQQYKDWQKQRVTSIEPAASAYIGNDALYARTDTTLSVYIPSGKLFKPYSSTPLKTAAFSLFDNVSRLISEYPELSLYIAGHEADDKDEEYNLLLSTKRAKNLLLLYKEYTKAERHTPPYSSGYGSSYLNKLPDFPYNALIEFRLTPCR